MKAFFISSFPSETVFGFFMDSQIVQTAEAMSIEFDKTSEVWNVKLD